MTQPIAPGPRLQRQVIDGATVVTLEDHSLPLVRIAVALRNGALADPDGASGSTRILFEMLLRGTEFRDRPTFNAELERLGSSAHAAIGPYSALVRGVALRRNLEPTLALLTEAISAPALAAGELTPLLEEVTEALRAERDDDDSLAELFLRRALYPGHALRRSPNGAVSEIAGLGVAQLRAAHAARLCRRDLIVTFAGDITPEEARTAVAPLLEALPPGEGAVVWPPAPPPPEPQGLRILIVDKPERTQGQLRLARPMVDGNHEDAFSVWLGAVAFGGTMTSPFSHEVREVRGWSYVAYADFDRRGVLPAPLFLRSAPATSDVVDCLSLELDMYRDLARGKLDTEVVEAARSYLLNHYPLQVATIEDLEPAVLRDELIGVSPQEIFEVPSRLEAIDPAQVGSVVQRHSNPDNLVVTVVATATDVERPLRQRFPEATLSVVDFRDGLSQ